MHNQELFRTLDECFTKTISKYGPVQLEGSIIKYLIEDDISSISGAKEREKITKLGKSNIKKALLINIIKIESNIGLSNLRNITTFSKNYANHTMEETEIRILQTLLLSKENKFKDKAIKECDYIISNEGTALINIVKSFIDTRYINKDNRLDNDIYSLEYIDIIDNINKYY